MALFAALFGISVNEPVSWKISRGTSFTARMKANKLLLAIGYFRQGRLTRTVIGRGEAEAGLQGLEAEEMGETRLREYEITDSIRM